MEKIVVSGLVVVKEGRLLVANDGKDFFFKIPGGKVLSNESLEDCALRELDEETGFKGRVIKKLSMMKLKKKPQTGEIIDIYLYHFKGKLINEIKDFKNFKHNHHKISWIKIDKLKNYSIGPNIKFLIDNGDII